MLTLAVLLGSELWEGIISVDVTTKLLQDSEVTSTAGFNEVKTPDETARKELSAEVGLSQLWLFILTDTGAWSQVTPEGNSLDVIFVWLSSTDFIWVRQVSTACKV